MNDLGKWSFGAPETSREGARVAQAETQRQRVWEALSSGKTDDQIARALGIQHRAASTRRKELEDQFRVCDSGLRVIGNHPNTQVVVWRRTTPDEEVELVKWCRQVKSRLVVRLFDSAFVSDGELATIAGECPGRMDGFNLGWMGKVAAEQLRAKKKIKRGWGSPS